MAGAKVTPFKREGHEKELPVIEDLFQLGDVAEHRGIVVIPIFPRRDPVASYITLDEALPSGFCVRR